jgi:putative ABC transport system ATP-binding protein
LLSCLGGILKPKAGRITFGDIDVTALDNRDLSNYGRDTVGIVFQAFNLVPSRPAIENVMQPLRAAGTPRRTARTHRPGDMSGGQQQRVAVARAIVLDPPLILADAPYNRAAFPSCPGASSGKGYRACMC